MNIVCVAACTAGIAHTYIAREKLIKGAKALGHNVKVETQVDWPHESPDSWYHLN